jgi:cold shock CspA family protein
MPTTDEHATHTTGTVEWFDAERGVGLISSDDGAPPCTVRSDTLRACGLDALAAGDRVRFRVQDEGGERAVTDLSLLPAVQRWENEGGAVRPNDPEA